MRSHSNAIRHRMVIIPQLSLNCVGEKIPTINSMRVIVGMINVKLVENAETSGFLFAQMENKAAMQITIELRAILDVG